MSTSPLDSERWQRLRALFDEASSMPAPNQAAFVSRHCQGDPTLLASLRGMLAASDEASDVIRSAISAVWPRDDAASEWVGRSVGPYRIVREVGRGGMGLVFEAAREDEYTQRVALKVAPWTASHPEVDARFRQERQILADLEHPGIARLLDGGRHQGTPYLVMEFVDGVPVTEYCRARRLSVRERVGLARQMCAALQYAHQHLVVHRDLKPSNILVADGAVKVLDFGIARLLEPGRADTPTIGGSTGLTPDYASPEQVHGRPVSTRSDIYSLGLVLYEMLTGVRAQVADTSSALALTASVEREPPLASRCAAERGDVATARVLRGDLDTIVATAIRKDPGRRYGSMDAFADDLGRWLDGRPVLARPQTAWYRAVTRMRRHRTATVAAACAVVALAGGVASTWYQARRAERQFQQVRKLARTMIVDVHDRIDDLAGATDARRFIVATSLEYLESLRADAGSDAELARELAAGYERVGLVQGHPLRSNLGDTAGAIASFRRADALLAPLVAQGDRQAGLLAAETMMELADTLRATGDAPGAMAAYARARAVAEALVAGHPDDAIAARRLADICAAQSRAANTLDDRALTAAAGTCAVAQAERVVALVPDDPSAKDSLATALNAAGGALVSTRPSEAARFFQESIDVREALVEASRDNANYRRSLMVSYGNLGDVLGYRAEHLARPEAAVAAFRKALAIAETAMAADPADRRAAFDVVNATLRLGSVLGERLAAPGEALPLLRRADSLNERLLGEERAAARYGAVGLTLDRQLAATLAALGRPREAEAYLERVRRRAPGLANGPAAPTVRTILLRSTLALAQLRADAGDPRARDLVAEVVRELPPTSPPSPAVGRILTDLARTHLALARHAALPARRRDADAAVGSAEAAVSVFRALTLAPEVEHVRSAGLAELDRLFDELRHLADDRPRTR